MIPPCERCGIRDEPDHLDERSTHRVDNLDDDVSSGLISRRRGKHALGRAGLTAAAGRWLCAGRGRRCLARRRFRRYRNLRYAFVIWAADVSQINQ